MYKTQCFDIHVQKLKPMVAETLLLYYAVSLIVRLEEGHSLEEMSLILSDSYHSAGSSAQLMWVVAKIFYANKAIETTESDNP
jgi:hypothetical protein